MIAVAVLLLAVALLMLHRAERRDVDAITTLHQAITSQQELLRSQQGLLESLAKSSTERLTSESERSRDVVASLTWAKASSPSRYVN